jgi:hypothetical protein
MQVCRVLLLHPLAMDKQAKFALYAYIVGRPGPDISGARGETKIQGPSINMKCSQ